MKPIYKPLLFLILITSTVFAQHDYLKAVHLTTYFLGANRCGDTKSWIHGACHTGDGQAVGVDLTGSWHDCGDHIKFGHTTSYTATTILLAYLHFPYFPDRYAQDYSAPPPNGIPDVLDEVKIHTDFLLRAYDNGTVYYQVGDGRNDHSSFSEPVYQTTSLDSTEGGEPRAIYSITEGGSNYCGQSAAALALMSLVYRKYDPSYADQCAAMAVNYYNVGDAVHEAIGTPGDYYGAGNWADDMALGAVELFRATGDSAYLTAAENFWNHTNFGPPEDWYVSYEAYVESYVNYELYKITGEQKYLDGLGEQITAIFWQDTTCGYMHYSDWSSLFYAGMAAVNCFYDYDLTNDNSRYNFAKSTVDFVLGSHPRVSADAPADFSFIIGYDELGGGYPQAPHHCASFGRGADAWDQFSEEAATPGSVGFLHELTGAVVGGPKAACGNYVDNIDDYVSNEVCIYYNAPYIAAASFVNHKENAFQKELVYFMAESLTVSAGEAFGHKLVLTNPYGGGTTALLSSPFTWDINIHGTDSISAAPDADGTGMVQFTITVNDSVCDTLDLHITVEANVGLSEKTMPGVGSFKVVPQHSTGNHITFLVDLQHQSDYALSVYNIRGRKVWDYQSKPAADTPIRWNIGQTGNGIYFARLRQGDRNLLIRFPVMK